MSPHRLEFTGTLVYKRDHEGDPENGVFGWNDCMGPIRDWPFVNVIGIGGIGGTVDPSVRERINWIGLGARRLPTPTGYRGSLVVFDHFLDCNSWGYLTRTVARNLAARMYDINVRVTTRFDRATQREINRLLAWAANERPSPVTLSQLRELLTPTQLADFQPHRSAVCRRSTRGSSQARRYPQRLTAD